MKVEMTEKQFNKWKKQVLELFPCGFNGPRIMPCAYMETIFKLNKQIGGMGSTRECAYCNFLAAKIIAGGKDEKVTPEFMKQVLDYLNEKKWRITLPYDEKNLKY
jgi:hypothetical protein